MLKNKYTVTITLKKHIPSYFYAFYLSKYIVYVNEINMKNPNPIVFIDLIYLRLSEKCNYVCISLFLCNRFRYWVFFDINIRRNNICTNKFINCTQLIKVLFVYRQKNY